MWKTLTAKSNWLPVAYHHFQGMEKKSVSRMRLACLLVYGWGADAVALVWICVSELTTGTRWACTPLLTCGASTHGL